MIKGGVVDTGTGELTEVAGEIVRKVAVAVVTGKAGSLYSLRIKGLS